MKIDEPVTATDDAPEDRVRENRGKTSPAASRKAAVQIPAVGKVAAHAPNPGHVDAGQNNECPRHLFWLGGKGNSARDFDPVEFVAVNAGRDPERGPGSNTAGNECGKLRLPLLYGLLHRRLQIETINPTGAPDSRKIQRAEGGI